MLTLSAPFSTVRGLAQELSGARIIKALLTAGLTLLTTELTLSCARHGGRRLCGARRLSLLIARLSLSLGFSLITLRGLRHLRRLTLRGKSDQRAELIIILTLLFEAFINCSHVRLSGLQRNLLLRVLLRKLRLSSACGLSLLIVLRGYAL
jgi:hypothetical protein